MTVPTAGSGRAGAGRGGGAQPSGAHSASAIPPRRSLMLDIVSRASPAADFRRETREEFGCVDPARVTPDRYWIADPMEQTWNVHRREPRGYCVVLTAGQAEVVRAEPFESVELRVAALLGIEDDEG